eukprot:GILK01004290.1.p1 GENE.GILK01004290.1~~GILK01004290.1.p1  ORF type:complete len:1251 (-),score=266.14 GILK01004290.1:264-4016(-)
MRTVVSWADRIPEREGISNTIWDVAFRPDGSQIIVGVGNRVLVYDATDGDLLHSLKGHTDSVYCVAYSKDGKRFASGGADKQVIIWTNKAEGILRYTHNDPIQCLAYNPVTQQLASGTASDFGLWSPEQKSVNKLKVPSKILSMAWTNDGQYIALGLFNGHVSIRDKSGNEKADIVRSAPIWCLEWNPSKTEAFDILAVGCWDQTLSFYQVSGLQQGKDKVLGFDPCSISFFSNGEFLVISGSDKKASLWTKDGTYLGPVAEREDWVWSAKVRPKQNYLAVGCNDGTLTMYQVIFSTVHGLYQDRYAYRELMTDVIIQHLVTEQKRRIKCRDYVKKIAVYRDRLAVQMSDRIYIYEVSHEDSYDMHYRIRDKINKKLECSLLVVTSLHIILCQEKRLQMYNFRGDLEREWVLDSLIRYIKVVGGPPGREGLLLGQKNGHIMKIFIDNPFPVTLIKQPTAVRCLDLSASRSKLAVVDEVANVLVYDLNTKELLFQEPNANSVAWNTDLEDMLAYSGNGLLSIKTGMFPPNQQKLQGFVVGFKGSKIFCLHFVAMQTIDVPQSASMYRYIEKKDFETAYQVACLGVTDNDWRMLAVEALQTMNFGIARKAFIRVRDIRFIDLLNRIEQERKKPKVNENILLAEIYAYQNKFHEAAKIYARGQGVEKAVEMFTDLRMWDEAKQWALKAEKTGKKLDDVTGAPDVTAPRKDSASDMSKKLIAEQAKWSVEVGDWKAAAEMYKASGDYRRAIDIFGPKGFMEPLIEIARLLNKSELEALALCATYFKKHGQHQYAKETYLKMGDIKSLLALHVEMHKWDDAFLLAQQYQEYAVDIYLPYAEYLVANDRFDEAQSAYWKAGRPDLSIKMLEQLAHNAVVERRYEDAGYYFWLLAVENLRMIKPQTSNMHPNNNLVLLTPEDQKRRAKFQEFSLYSELYYGYNFIRKYVEDPFTTILPETVFNVARYLSNVMGKEHSPHGVSRVYIWFALAKQSRSLGAFKLARYSFDKLQGLRIPRDWQEQIDIASLVMRSKPYSDAEELLPVCNRCMNANPLVLSANAGGSDICSTCSHPFIHSFVSFEALPLVEFVPDDGVSHAEAQKWIEVEPPSQRAPSRQEEDSDSRMKHRNKASKDSWREAEMGGAQTLTMDGDDDNGDVDSDPFIAKMLEIVQYQVPGEPYVAVKLDQPALLSLRKEEVFIVDYKSPAMQPRYFKTMVPEMPICMCKKCCRFFLQEDFEVSLAKANSCPFCRAADPEKP